MITDDPSFLYLLTEDDNDDDFLEMCAERITGNRFYRVDPRRIRRGGGISAVRTALPAFVNDLKATEGMSAFFIVALDNDRAPEHPEHNRPKGLAKKDMSKRCRYCEISHELEKRLGTNYAEWPAKGAIAVPVQMLESWVLLGVNPDRGSLPIFKRKTQAIAKNFYSGPVPDQLADLCDEQRGATPTADFDPDVASKMDVDAVTSKSPSFDLFRNQLASW